MKPHKNIIWIFVIWALLMGLGTIHCGPSTPVITDGTTADDAVSESSLQEASASQNCRFGEQKVCQLEGIGECGKGTRLCNEKSLSWGECIAKSASPEQCNDGLDNDCNGQVDEDCCIPNQVVFTHSNLMNPDDVPDAAIHPDLNEIAYLTNRMDNKANYWGITYRSTTTNKVIEETGVGRSWGSGTVAYSPDGKMLIVSNIPMKDKNVELLLIHRSDGKIVHQLTTTLKKESSLINLTYSANGDIIAAGFWGGGNEDWAPIVLWDARTGKHIRTIETDHYRVSALALSPDGQRVATGGRNSIVNVWRVADGKLLQSLLGEVGEGDSRYWMVFLIAFHPTQPNIIATTGANGKPPCTIQIWDLATSTRQHTLPWPNHGWFTGFYSDVCAHNLRFAFSPNGKWLAGAVAKRYLWDTSTYQRRVELSSFIPPNIKDKKSDTQHYSPMIRWSANNRQILFGVKYNMTLLKCP